MVKDKTANRITTELLIELPKRFSDSMVWRNNTGTGIAWSAVKGAIGCLQRRDIDGALKLLVRPIRFGLIGSADVIGLIDVHGAGIFIAFEVKTTDQQSPEQIAFERRVRSLGGIYLVCRDVDDCLDELELELELADIDAAEEM